MSLFQKKLCGNNNYTVRGLVIDYAPNTNGKQLLQQEQLYRYNQIPAVLLGPKSLMEPDWQESLYETLQQEAKRPNDLSRCRGT